MPETINGISYYSAPFSIRLDRIASVVLGFLVVFTGPINDNLLVNFGGYYRLNLFEFTAIPIILLGLFAYGIRIKRYEQFLFLSLILVLLSRAISLLVSEDTVTIQWAGLLRYIGSTLGIIYILANLLTDSKNRNLFIYGLIIGVTIESIGGLLNFILSPEMARGYFLSVATSGIQMFLIFACISAFMKKHSRFLMIIIILLLSISVVSTLSRGAIIGLMLVFIVTLLYAGYSRKRFLQLIFLITLIIGTSFVIIRVAPWMIEQLLWRIETGISEKEGGVVERLVLYEMCVNAFLQLPVTGIGSGGIKEQQGSLETLTREIPAAFSGYRLSPHSTILGIIAETGIIGLTAYLLWMIAVIGICIKVLHLSKKPNGKNNIYAIAASLWIILAITYGDLLAESSFYPVMNSLVGFVLGWLRDNKRPLNTIKPLKEDFERYASSIIK